MIGTQLVYLNPGNQTVEVNAGWQDTAKEILTYTNYGPHAVVFERAEFVNGTTAAGATGPIITVSTPNCDYTVGAGAASFPALGAAYADNIGEDRIEQNQTVKAVITQVPASAKEFKFRLLLGCVGRKSELT